MTDANGGMIRTRANVAKTSTGKWSFDCTVEVGDPHLTDQVDQIRYANVSRTLYSQSGLILHHLDHLIEELEKRYGTGRTAVDGPATDSI
ncbi:hypothetical protein [uncultured Mediterranean phage uvDeep-CGR2-KM21-C338]|nr:hypothetical protein [uncultured Mediterranean phage uvDeep-CGR2-KM21-C338]